MGNILEEINQKIAEVYYKLLLELGEKEEVLRWCYELEQIINLYVERKTKESVYSERKMIKLAEKYRNKEIENSLEEIMTYIIQKTLVPTISKEVEKIKEFIKEEKVKKGKELGKKVNKKIKKESYLIELITSFINKSRIKFLSEFGSKFGREFLSEFEIEFEREFLSEFGIEFGSNFERKFGIEFRETFQKQKVFIFKNKSFKENSLNFISALPFYSIISFLCTIKGYEYLYKLRDVLNNKILANSFGYHFGYYFINKKDVYDILTSSTLEICEENFDYTKNKFPFISYIPCNFLSIDKENKIILNFDMKNLEKRTIQIDNLFLLKCYLNYYLSFSFTLPAFRGYEEIAIENEEGYIPCCTKNYKMILWQNIKKIKEYCLSSEQEKQQFINKLMNYEGEEGKRVKSVINYTYHNRVYKNENETYEQIIESIRKTYKQFMSDVLDCIMLSEEELKKIRLEDREDLL